MGRRTIDPANGIYKPADVTPHWQEVGQYSRMPIDGTIMETDPIQSSFPASRIYKAIQQLDSPSKAIEYIRLVRESVFVFNKNISNQTVLKDIVHTLYKDNHDMDIKHIFDLANSQKGHRLLTEDFNLVRQLGVRGFPMIVIINNDNKGTKIVGSRALNVYIETLKTLDTTTKMMTKPLPNLELYLKEQHRLFSKEIETMYDIKEDEVPQFVKEHIDPSRFSAKSIRGENYFESTST